MTEAIRASIATTAYAAERLRAIDGVELVMEPELTVILFRKRGVGRRPLAGVGARSARARDRVRGADHDGRARRSAGSCSSTR